MTIENNNINIHSDVFYRVFHLTCPAQKVWNWSHIIGRNYQVHWSHPTQKNYQVFSNKSHQMNVSAEADANHLVEVDDGEGGSEVFKLPGNPEEDRDVL